MQFIVIYVVLIHRVLQRWGCNCLGTEMGPVVQFEAWDLTTGELLYSVPQATVSAATLQNM